MKLFLSFLLLVSVAYAMPNESYSIVIGSDEVSFISSVIGLPTHTLSLQDGEKVERKFGRGFLRPGGVNEYLFCVVTNTRKIWVWGSTGKIKVTDLKTEIYL
jgi:hypothetical protein